MSALLERYFRLSEAQRARFLGHLFGYPVDAFLESQTRKSFEFAESTPREFEEAPKERPHEAIGRIAREARGEGL